MSDESEHPEQFEFQLSEDTLRDPLEVQRLIVWLGKSAAAKESGAAQILSAMISSAKELEEEDLSFGAAFLDWVWFVLWWGVVLFGLYTAMKRREALLRFAKNFAAAARGAAGAEIKDKEVGELKRKLKSAEEQAAVTKDHLAALMDKNQANLDAEFKIQFLKEDLDRLQTTVNELRVEKERLMKQNAFLEDKVIEAERRADDMTRNAERQRSVNGSSPALNAGNPQVEEQLRKRLRAVESLLDASEARYHKLSEHCDALEREHSQTASLRGDGSPFNNSLMGSSPPSLR